MTLPVPTGGSRPGQVVPQQEALTVFFGSAESVIYHSFPPDQAPKVLRYLNGKVSSLADQVGGRVSVEHLIAHHVEAADAATGELRRLVRLVLVSPTGEGWATTSGGVLTALRQLLAVYGPPPWQLTLEVQRLETRRGRQFLTVTPAA
jgi:hypothetical protein